MEEKGTLVMSLHNFGDFVTVGEDIKITYVSHKGKQICLAVTAPKKDKIKRHVFKQHERDAMKVK
jgi:sRNA-binding carbon storage regulator CsrA